MAAQIKEMFHDGDHDNSCGEWIAEIKEMFDDGDQDYHSWREWIAEIKEMFHDGDHDNSLPSTAAILRVPAPLRKMKPEAFIPQLLSLGPYHYSNLEKDIDSPCAECKISMVEVCKGKFAARLSQKLRHCGKNFKCIIELMKGMRVYIERFYGWPISTEGQCSQNFALMMAIDSSFLLQFLISRSSNIPMRTTLPLDSDTQDFCTTYYNCILHDIKKVENQIPLFVLKAVLNYVIQDSRVCAERVSLKDLLPDICKCLFPFPYDIQHLDIAEDQRNKLIDEMAKEPHILGCIHRFLSQFLQMQSGKWQQTRKEIRSQEFNGILNMAVIWIRGCLPTVPGSGILLQKYNRIRKNLVKWIGGFGLLPAGEFSKGMSARQLETAGIKFKSFTKVPNYIRLDKGSSTLYLPHIVVSEISTEVDLRNMLALEFNDNRRPKYMTRYVDLMGQLIQSQDDVRILLDREVISRGRFGLTDECIAKMFHDVRQPFVRGSLTDVHDELFTAVDNWFERNYWKNKIKRKLCRLYYFVLSWKFAGPVAVFLGLVMTAIQTYCGFHHCSR